jgi:drug/metabolite transporter (DMT)-like permease
MFELIINSMVIVSLLVAIYALFNYLKEKNEKFAWWKWSLSILWLLAVLLIFGFIGTTIGEGEPGAALRGGGVFLVLLAISGVAFFRLLFGDMKGKQRVDQPVERKANSEV